MLEDITDSSNEPTTVDIVLPIGQSEDLPAQKAAVALKLDIPVDDLTELRLLKHSIDARQKQIKVQLRVEVGIQKALPIVESPSPKSRVSQASALQKSYSISLHGLVAS